MIVILHHPTHVGKSNSVTDRSLYSTLLLLCFYLCSLVSQRTHEEITDYKHYYLLQDINNDLRERQEEKDALYTFRLITVRSQSHFLMDNLMY